MFFSLFGRYTSGVRSVFLLSTKRVARAVGTLPLIPFPSYHCSTLQPNFQLPDGFHWLLETPMLTCQSDQ